MSDASMMASLAETVRMMQQQFAAQQRQQAEQLAAQQQQQAQNAMLAERMTAFLALATGHPRPEAPSHVFAPPPPLLPSPLPLPLPSPSPSPSPFALPQPMQPPPPNFRIFAGSAPPVPAQLQPLRASAAAEARSSAAAAPAVRGPFAAPNPRASVSAANAAAAAAVSSSSSSAAKRSLSAGFSLSLAQSKRQHSSASSATSCSSTAASVSITHPRINKRVQPAPIEHAQVTDAFLEAAAKSHKRQAGSTTVTDDSVALRSAVRLAFELHCQPDQRTKPLSKAETRRQAAILAKMRMTKEELEVASPVVDFFHFERKGDTKAINSTNNRVHSHTTNAMLQPLPLWDPAPWSMRLTGALVSGVLVSMLQMASNALILFLLKHGLISKEQEVATRKTVQKQYRNWTMPSQAKGTGGGGQQINRVSQRKTRVHTAQHDPWAHKQPAGERRQPLWTTIPPVSLTRPPVSVHVCVCVCLYVCLPVHPCLSRSLVTAWSVCSM